FLAACVLTGILSGLAPALQISRTNVNENLRDGSRSISGGTRRARRITSTLLVAEIRLTLVLLVGAGLMMRSFLNSQRVNIGVNIENLMTAQVQPPAIRYPEAANRLASGERLHERLKAVPGIDKLTLAS